MSYVLDKGPPWGQQECTASPTPHPLAQGSQLVQVLALGSSLRLGFHGRSAGMTVGHVQGACGPRMLQ